MMLLKKCYSDVIGSDTSCVPLAYRLRHVLRAAGLLTQTRLACRWSTFFLKNPIKLMYLAVIVLQKNNRARCPCNLRERKKRQRSHCYRLPTVNARRPCNLRERKKRQRSLCYRLPAKCYRIQCSDDSSVHRVIIKFSTT